MGKSPKLQLYGAHRLHTSPDKTEHCLFRSMKKKDPVFKKLTCAGLEALQFLRSWHNPSFEDFTCEDVHQQEGIAIITRTRHRTYIELKILMGKLKPLSWTFNLEPSRGTFIGNLSLEPLPRIFIWKLNLEIWPKPCRTRRTVWVPQTARQAGRRKIELWIESLTSSWFDSARGKFCIGSKEHWQGITEGLLKVWHVLEFGVWERPAKQLLQGFWGKSLHSFISPKSSAQQGQLPPDALVSLIQRVSARGIFQHKITALENVKCFLTLPAKSIHSIHLFASKMLCAASSTKTCVYQPASSFWKLLLM